MKKTAIAVAVAGLMSLSVAHAAPQSNTWYSGAKLGWSNYQASSNDFASSDITNKKRDDVGGGVFAGYQFNNWFALEGGYDYLGKLKYDTATGSDKLQSQGLQLAGKFSYAVTPALDLYGKAGVFGSYSQNNETHKYGVSPLLAVGTEYAINRDWAARMEYQWISDIGSKSDLGVHSNNGLLSVGISYRFGQVAPAVAAPAPAPEPAPAPAPAPVTETKDFNLSSDVLFDFGKSTLKPAGVTALNNLFASLQAETPKDGSTVVIGYTDRIGSAQSNQILSEKRARTVADFLIKKGIPASKVSTRGMGKANPVTGTQCDGVKQKAKLVACLAPDRRVTIEVTGTKEVQK